MQPRSVVPWVDRRPRPFRAVQRLLVWPARVAWAVLGGYRLALPMPTLWGRSAEEIAAALRAGHDHTLHLTCSGRPAWIAPGSNRVHVHTGEARTVRQLSSAALPVADVSVVGYEPRGDRAGRLGLLSGRARVTVDGNNRAPAVSEAFVR